MNDDDLLAVAKQKIAKILGQAQVDSKTAVLIYQVLVDTLEKPLREIFDMFPELRKQYNLTVVFANECKDWKVNAEKRVFGGKQP